MKIILLILSFFITSISFSQTTIEKSNDTKRSLDSMSIVYKKNVSSFFILETKDIIIKKIYFRESEFGEEKLFLVTKEFKVPNRLTN